MAIRITIDGIPVTCDTPQEALDLLHAAKRGMNREQPKKYEHARQYLKVKPVSKSEAALFPSGPYPFKRSHREVLNALKEAFPTGTHTDELAARIGGKRMSLPIIMVGLQTYAKKRNLRWEELIVREEPPPGMKGSIYRMTPKGLKEFFG